jgi:hypothetical protein
LTNFDIGFTLKELFAGGRMTEIRVDWFRVITDICRKGHTLESIGAHIGTCKQTVHRWKEGSEPSYKDGAALVELWRSIVVPDLPRQIDDRGIRRRAI